MSDHEAPTTEAPTNGTGSDEAPANETLERVDQALQIAELEDAWRRTAAELDNFRKRCARDVVRGREQERAAVAASWLPVLDNLERALEHASSDPDSVVEGLRAVLAQAVGVLRAFVRRSLVASCPVRRGLGRGCLVVGHGRQ